MATSMAEIRRRSFPGSSGDAEVYPSIENDDTGDTASEMEQYHCQSSLKNCRRPKLKGFDFCHKHILEDKNSPFQRCCFASKSSGKLCTNPAPKIRDKKTFCLVHTRNPKLKKAHAEQLKRKKTIGKANTADGDQNYILRSNLNSPEARNSKHRKRTPSGGLDVAEENIDSMMVQTTWFGDEQSDAESVDSEDEDPLRHADVWTLEEGLRIYCNKLRRLKFLYKRQYNRLTHVLKERRREHLLQFNEDSKFVKEEQPVQTSQEDLVLRSYQRFSGVELLLMKQAREKRLRVSQKTTYQLKCHHSTQGQRCQNKVLPLAKYCSEHICEDSNQFLFKQCAFEGKGQASECHTPVFSLKGGPFCNLHFTLMPHIPNEALLKIEHDRQQREKTKADSTEEKSAATTQLPKATSELPIATPPGARTLSPGNIFSILKSVDPKDAKSVSSPTPEPKLECNTSNEAKKEEPDVDISIDDPKPGKKDKENQATALTPPEISL